MLRSALKSHVTVSQSTVGEREERSSDGEALKVAVARRVVCIVAQIKESYRIDCSQTQELKT
jgi:hypothetical protein